ncbi:MAG: hypothetical protein BWK80_54230 [Desulfobacteraceae bacterium IS3]|nr:MAG: hypothetical protein BWK80_54230 [Desulfobacteraceae bacterium IS3]
MILLTLRYHIPVYVCSHIFENTRPVLLVNDGDWQMLCGGEHDEDEIPGVVGLGHLLERDRSLSEILDLPDDWEAEKESSHASWTRRRSES